VLFLPEYQTGQLGSLTRSGSALLVRRHDICGRVAPGDLLEVIYARLDLMGSLTQVHHDSGCALVDACHHGNLRVTLGDVGLIDADGVDPNQARLVSVP
jgi:hypothetical protein